MVENEQEKDGLDVAKLGDTEQEVDENPKTDLEKDQMIEPANEAGVDIKNSTTKASDISDSESIPEIEDESTPIENRNEEVKNAKEDTLAKKSHATAASENPKAEINGSDVNTENEKQGTANEVVASTEEKEAEVDSVDHDVQTKYGHSSMSEEEKHEKSSEMVEKNATASTSEINEDSADENVEGLHVEAHLDYSNYDKKQMVQVLESLLKEDDFSQVGRILKEIKKPYDKLVNGERKKAFGAYIEDGGEKDGFEYRFDELDNRFNNAYNKLRERKNQFYNSLEKQKESNLNIKLDLLEKLRELVDSEETGSSIKALKDIQSKWKEVGTIPSSQAKGLWANYNALLDRFYDQRSIYFELKELDRKKNHDLKIDVCERAELLIEQDNIREVIKHLNELHDEFKHIGPVPKEDQEKIWDRFKSASDKIYARRKEFFDKLKDELKLNEVAKEALVEKVMPFADFESERISDWNSKTKEVLAIQKEWEKIGALPKERAKLINKKFWTSFKSFFNKKGQFFKKIDENRKANLELKQKLVQQAEELKESEDFNETSEKLKALQRQWKEIGAVPEKYRNEVFFKFKKACDHFFDRRRSNSGKVEKDYEENLKKKKSLCGELEKMIADDKIDLDRVKAIEEEWSHVGFVPKSSIKSILKRHTDVINSLTDQADIPENEKHKMRFSAQFSNMNYGPGAEKLIHKKEGALRRQVSNLENDINLWKNNIDFFASSKNADKLKAEFQEKIDKAAQELKNLKDQLKVVSNM